MGSQIEAIHLLSRSASSDFNLNGASFQQDGITSHRGWQYVAYYINQKDKENNNSNVDDGQVETKSRPTRNVCLARRKLDASSYAKSRRNDRDQTHSVSDGESEKAIWQTIVFDDYEQVLNDGHNTISLGLSHSDGSIHLSFDNHNTRLVYRRSCSTLDLISQPDEVPYRDVVGGWSKKSFQEVREGLEGLDTAQFESATYPRFLSLPACSKSSASLLLEFRTGMAGLGDTRMCIYGSRRGDDSSGTSSYGWEARGVVLQGVGCNAYINGLTLHRGSASMPASVHLTWTYRSYIPVTLKDSQQQAGPNGPENNHDLYYAWSPFEEDRPGAMGGPGRRWFNGMGELIGLAGNPVVSGSMNAPSSHGLGPVLPTSPGILAYKTSADNKGITNQESQAVDSQGGVHVLNREEVDGLERWVYYTLPEASGGILNDRVWERHLLPHPKYSPASVFHPRGKMFCATPYDVPHLYIFLPRELDLVLIRRSLRIKSGWRGEWEEVLRLPGARMMEVLVDEERLNRWDHVLSVYIGKYFPEEMEFDRHRRIDGNTGEECDYSGQRGDSWMSILDITL